MKRLIFVLGGLLALPAFAEVSPFFYDATAEFADTDIDTEEGMVETGIVIEQSTGQKAVTPSRPSVRSNASSRSGSRASVSRAVSSRSNGVARNTATAGVSRGVASRASVSRSASGNTGVVSRRGTAANSANVARAGTTTMLTTSSNPLYLPNNTGRVSYRTAPTSSSTRSPSISVNNTTTTTTLESVREATETMDSLAELTDYCKAQYTACMDNFCNVLDDNQGRCTCSKNVKNYEKTEEALRAATEELQDVAQRIQYIGLTGDEINTLFSQTEAELAMQNTTDTTKLKNDLDRIKNMLVDVKTGASNSISESGGISLDFSNLLSFNIDSYGFDLSALFGTTSSSNTQSIANQRGEALYKSAASRCKTAVLTNCIAQGVEASVIVNAYDMEIDKQCIRYERALTDSNQQMSATVRNAKTVLQKARLMVAQQKNQYDLRGCISALDSCMRDDYVCGPDYEECLDPTGKYIVGGQVVSGSMPGQPGGSWGSDDNIGLSADKGLYTTWNVGGTGNQNIWSPASNNTYTMADYIDKTLDLTKAMSKAPKDISEFLQTKIGYHNDSNGRNYGMCMSVLNKCQAYTYDENGKYNPRNAVIAEFMQRAFRQIKSSQDNVLSNYATNCLSEVTSCLSQNNYQFSASISSSSVNPSDMAIRACLPVINTCRSVTLNLGTATVSTDSLDPIYAWLDAGIATTYRSTCENTGGTWNATNGVCTCSDENNLKASDSNRYCVCKVSTYVYDSATGTCVQ